MRRDGADRATPFGASLDLEARYYLGWIKARLKGSQNEALRRTLRDYALHLGAPVYVGKDAEVKP